MKKILLTSLAAFLVCFAAHSQIVITEIMYNPPESGVDSLEYIELYNASAATVDISGWNFTQGVEHVFPTGTVYDCRSVHRFGGQSGLLQCAFWFYAYALDLRCAHQWW